MCGIVGYVGEQSALEVVIEGLRRLEYRGYDSAGVALIADGKLRRPRSGPASWPTSRPRWPSDPLPAGDDRHRAHPLGHPRRARTTATPTRTSTAPARSRSSTTASSRTSPQLRAELEERGHELASDTDTEAVAHLLEEEYASTATAVDLAEAMRAVCRRLEGAFTLVADARRRARRRRRRSPQLPAGRRPRRRRELPRLRRRRVHRAHPRGASSSARTRSSSCAGTASRSPTSTAARRRARVPRRLGPLGRREGRLRLLHAQGDRRAAAGRRRHDARPARRRRPARPRRDAALRRRPARRRQDHRHRVRHGVPRRPGREVRHRALDPDPVRGRAGVGVPLPRPGPRPARR